MKIYNVYPNFTFQVEAENEEEANSKAYDELKRMGGFDFDFDIEEEEGGNDE